MTSSNLEGSTLGGRYQIQSLIGRGGMAAVYKAHDPNLQRTVAVKVIHSQLSNNQDFLRRFEEEATLIARLRHPNIVQIYDFSHEDGKYFMVMEYLAGETLQVRLKRLRETNRHMPIQEAIRYGEDIISAASYAHQRGLVHRDIKPANVMLDIQGKAILMDFGIAKMLGGSRHTATGAVLGTAMYMAPEQIQGIQVDARADIYSIGVTLFEMLGGRPPYEADSAMTLMMMHLNDPIPDVRKLQPEVPVNLVEILNKALAKNRDQRYQAAEEFVQALKKTSENAKEAIVIDNSSEKAPSPKDVLLKATILERLAAEEEKAGPDNRTIIEPISTPGAASASSDQDRSTAGAVTIQQRSDGQTIIERAPQSPPGSPQPPPGKPAGNIATQAYPIQRATQSGKQPRKLWLALLVTVIILTVCGGGFILTQYLDSSSGSSIPFLSEPGGFLAALFPSRAEPTPLVVIITSTPEPAATIAPSPDALTTQIAQEILPSPTLTPTITPEPTKPPIIIGGADKIAFIDGKNIWIANLDGSDLTQLTTDGTEKKYLRWLPSGEGLSYISGKCIKFVSIQGEDQVLTCFPNVDYLVSFEVSPDGTQVVISLDNLIYQVPFDIDALKEADRHSDLKKMASCSDLAPYQRNAARSIRWSKDGNKWAVIVIGVLKDGRRGDLIHVFAVDRCIPNPRIEIQFPPPHFSYPDYEKIPSFESFAWDGDALFSFNSPVRNEGYGNLQIFNMETYSANVNINPINQVCCYRDVQWSPDGNYLLFAFQNYLQGANSTAQIYFIPYGSIGTGATYEPLPLPVITNPREKPQPVLRPAKEP